MRNTKLNFSGLKALVIDDQRFIRRLVVSAIRDIGFDCVEEASDGASGLKINSAIKPDIIVCDIEMEPVDGFVFLETLRTSKDSVNRDVPLIFLTKYSDSGILRRAQAFGINGFIVKPPTIKMLRDRIAFALGIRSKKAC